MTTTPPKNAGRQKVPSGFLRINAPPPKPGEPGDQYLSRLVKLVPAEAVTLYLTFKEIAATWLGIWALVCLLVVVAVRTLGNRQSGKPIQIGAVVIATVSFVLWVYATGGYFLQIQPPASMPGIVSAGIGVWTFVVPYFYRGD